MFFLLAFLEGDTAGTATAEDAAAADKSKVRSRQTAYSSQQGIPGEPVIRLVVPKRTRCGCDVKKGGATTICSTKKVVAKVTKVN